MNVKNSKIMMGLLALSVGSSAIAAEATPGGAWANSPLVQKIRAATAAYKDPQAAIDAGYNFGTEVCVSGRDGGAMGIHYVNLGLLDDDGMVDATAPEVLIYEPLANGRLRLAGVEYIEIDDGDAATGSPVLDGHLLNYSGAPNRYGLPAYHELHVWAWKYNPDGTFADWNPRVSCDAYKVANGMGGH